MIEKKREIVHWVRLTGLGTILLGMINIALTPLVLYNGFTDLPFDRMSTFLFFYLATSLTILLCGLLLMHCTRGLANNETWAWPIALGENIFLILLGFGGLFGLAGNLWNYLLLVLALLELALLVVYRQQSPHPQGDGSHGS